ncbi:MAG: hypothetical protein ACRDY7_15725 [Acidimicrobiia bacterium]
MPKEKTSVTLDPVKVRRARELVPARSVSELLDLALARLIEGELEWRHVDGYLRHPPEGDELAWAERPRDAADVADDTDWAGLYGVER